MRLAKSLSAIFALFVLSASAQASIIHTFVFDDLSNWQSVGNVAVGDSITLQFADGTDFNNVTTSDIEGFGYNLAAGATEFYFASDYTTPAGNGGDLSTVFSEAGGIVSLTYSNSYVGYIQAVKNGIFAQFVPGQPWHLYAVLPGGGFAILQTLSSPVTYTSSSVSVAEPGTLALFGIGLLGIGFARRRKTG